MNEMYTSVFPVTRDQKKAGIQVVAIVACDKDVLETLDEMQKEKHQWPNTRLARADREGCITFLITTTDTDTVDILNSLYVGHEDSFAFLSVQVGPVADPFKVKLGDTEYFVKQDSDVLKEVPREEAAKSSWPIKPANDYLPDYSGLRHRPNPRTLTV